MTALPRSRLGFGVSGVHGTPLVPASLTRQLIEQAFALGITRFDTAPAYGAGEAERRLGEALSSLPRHDIVLTSKAGLTSSGLNRRIRDFSPDAIERSVRASLQRLGVEGLDGLFLHGAATDELTPALLSRLELLKSAGAFLSLGAAGRGAELDAAIATGAFDLLMLPVNPWIGEAAEARIAAARRAGLRIWAIETAGPGLPPLALPRRPAELYALARGLRTRMQGASGAGLRLPVLQGLRKALERPDIDVVLTTTSRPDHLDANASLLDAED